MPPPQTDSYVSFRISPEQKANLVEQADLGGMNVSDYVRHRVFGGRPIMASADVKMVSELRRFGGLLKNQCQLIREQNGDATVRAQLESLLKDVCNLITKIGLAYDRKED